MKDNMKKILFTFLFSMFMFAESAHAVVISRININGNQRMDTESVRILANVKVGEDVDEDKINTSAKKLQTSGYFSSVSAKTDGNILKINVVESPIINMVTIEGNDEISTDDLKKEIRTKERLSYDTAIIGAMCDAC